jgi:hypothetical protein
MKKLVPLTFAALLLSSTAVLAQAQSAFDRLDSDGDDKLSYSDLIGEWPDLTQADFDAADINTDDFLDLTEFEGLGSSRAEVDVAASGTVAPAVDFPSFESIDQDGDDKIGFDDLTGLGVTQEMFDAADVDNDDFVDRSQFEALKGHLGMAAPANVAVGLAQPAGNRPALADLDTDGDGKLDFSDLKAQWPDLTQEQFDAADIDNDDFLDESQYESLAI